MHSMQCKNHGRALHMNCCFADLWRKMVHHVMALDRCYGHHQLADMMMMSYLYIPNCELVIVVQVSIASCVTELCVADIV